MAKGKGAQATPEKYRLRAATEEDFPDIRRLIRQVRINPAGLDWRRFAVAVSAEGEVIACGQLKPVKGNLTELASLAVKPAFRGQGIARAMIERLLKQAPRPVYLTCRSQHGDLYAKFGFYALSQDETPKYYLRLQRLAKVFLGFSNSGETLLVMKLG